MAKPTPLPIGRANPHINQSRGAEPYIMNFYVTSYSTSFTKANIDNNKGRFKDIPAYSGNEEFKPRSAPENKKTGYTSNVRPQIYYNRNLDELDNPEMGRMLADNYNTITHDHYQAYKNNDGWEEIPAQVLGQSSAYTQHAYNHNPRPSEVHNLYTDTRIRAPYDVLPKHQALLHKTNDHNPLSKENHGYGPFYMSTETSTRFVPQKKEEKMNPAVGPKETSGFVNNKETEDVLLYERGERWMYDSKHTGYSEFKDKFQPYPPIRGDTLLPSINPSEKTKDSTYVKTFRPNEINPKGIDFGKPTEYREHYLGKRDPEPHPSEKLGTAVVGPKEIGGQSHCEHGKVTTLDDPRRFITNYQIKHFDMNPSGKDREGFVSGGVQNLVSDGYTKNPKVHNTGSLNTLAELRSMDPYQSRSIRAKDQHYDDHSHDHKFTLKTKSVTFKDNNPYSVNTSSF